MTARKQQKIISAKEITVSKTESTVNGHNTVPTTHRKKNYKITKMMATIIGLYYVLYLPVIVISQFDKQDKSVTVSALKRIAYLIIFVNYWINTFIYAWGVKDFKTAFGKILRGVFPTEKCARATY